MGLGLASPDRETLRNLFDQIASRYDLINSVLSLRLDEVWRRRAVELTLSGREECLLDLGVGTGRFLEYFLRKKTWRLAAGIDFSRPMLRLAQEKLPVEVPLIQADIHEIPFGRETFDVVAAAFTLRSVKDRPHFFEEVHRVLKPGGRVSFLCLTRPTSPLGRLLYAPYLKFFLPTAGRLISSSRTAYRFLSESIQAFPSPSEIAKELERFGFSRISIFPFTFGISTLIRAQR